MTKRFCAELGLTMFIIHTVAIGKFITEFGYGGKDREEYFIKYGVDERMRVTERQHW